MTIGVPSISKSRPSSSTLTGRGDGRIPSSACRVEFPSPSWQAGDVGGSVFLDAGLLLPGPVAACLVAMVLSPSRRLTDQNQNSFDERNSIGFQEGFRESLSPFLTRPPARRRPPPDPPAGSGWIRPVGRGDAGNVPIGGAGPSGSVRNQAHAATPTGSVIEECPRPPVGPVETDGASRPAVTADLPRAPRYSTLMCKPWPTTHFPDMRRTPCRIASVKICNHTCGSRYFLDAGQAS